MIRDALSRWIAYLMPERIVYWAIIRAWITLTVSTHPDKAPDEITVWDALKRFRN